MLEMNITITAAGLEAAINNLAAALRDKTPHFVCTQNGGTSHQIENVGTITMNTGNKAQPSTPAAQVNTAPAPTTMPAAHTAPVSTPAPVVPVSTVPTSAPQYTLEMIATAGSALIDSEKMDQLMQLLGKFGVQSLTDLKPESYGAVANDLRALGAKI